MTDPEIIIKVKEFIDKIDDWLIYYPLKELKLKKLYPSTIRTVKHCIVLDYMGLPINTNIICYFTKEGATALVNKLHMLASKRVLFLKGYGKHGILIYELHPMFIAILKIGVLDEIIEWREDYIIKTNPPNSLGELY